MSSAKMGERLLWFLLAVSVLVRFYHISTPLIDHHSWRQTDTAAIARNFYREGMDILHPQIDWRGTTKGYVESEFPLFAFLVAVSYKVFGLHEFLGRLLCIIFATSCTFVLYLLAKRLFSKPTALISALVFSLFPSSVYFGRAFMPDFMTLFFALLGVYFLVSWYHHGRNGSLILSSMFFAMAFLLKLSFAHLLILAAGIFWLKYGWKSVLKPALWAYVAVIGLPSILWYTHAHSLYQQTGLSFGIWNIGGDKWGNLSIWTNPKFYLEFIFTRLAQQNLTFPGFILFLSGVLCLWADRARRFMLFWLLALIFYLLVVAKGNWVHDYYQIPFLPFAALAIGAAVEKVRTAGRLGWQRIAVIALLCTIPVFSFTRLRQTYSVPQWKKDWLSLAETIKAQVPPDTLLATLHKSPDPVLLYLADRKGWTLTVYSVTDSVLENLAPGQTIYASGLVADFTNESAYQYLKSTILTLEVVLENNKYFIWKISPAG